MATPKQTRYIMHLLDENGFSTRFMDARFKSLGATMRERSGRVDDWVMSRTPAEASALVEKLKTMKVMK